MLVILMNMRIQRILTDADDAVRQNPPKFAYYKAPNVLDIFSFR